MMDMSMKDGMQKESKKESYFKCPNCKKELHAMLMDKKEDKGMSKDTSTMPMGELRNKITPPGMNSY